MGIATSGYVAVIIGFFRLIASCRQSQPSSYQSRSREVGRVLDSNQIRGGSNCADARDRHKDLALRAPARLGEEPAAQSAAIPPTSNPSPMGGKWACPRLSLTESTEMRSDQLGRFQAVLRSKSSSSVPNKSFTSRSLPFGHLTRICKPEGCSGFWARQAK